MDSLNTLRTFRKTRSTAASIAAPMLCSNSPMPSSRPVLSPRRSTWAYSRFIVVVGAASMPHW